jgi:ligand-binding sensor domain-containing protein
MNTRHSVILAFLIAILPLFAAGSNEYFKKITVAEGLSNNFVRAIYKDSGGFIWLGTLDGLDRFDGTNIKSFKNKFPEEYQRVNCITDIFNYHLSMKSKEGVIANK